MNDIIQKLQKVLISENVTYIAQEVCFFAGKFIIMILSSTNNLQHQYSVAENVCLHW